MRSSDSMQSALVFAVLLVQPRVALPDDAPDGDQQVPLPQWIWCDGDPESSVEFRSSLLVDVGTQQADLRFLGDFCAVEIKLNDVLVVGVDDFSPFVELDVLRFLRQGDNEIVISARRSEGPSAVAVEIELTDVDGTRRSLVTDASWLASVDDQPRGVAESHGEVSPELWGRNGRSIEISPFDNYEQWRLASGEEADAGGRFWTAPGFELDLVCTAEEDEGSWVSLAFDPRGRVVIAREDKGLLRFTFDRPGGQVVNRELVNDTLEECRGLLFVGDDLYANANNSKGVYRLADTSGDSPLGAPQLIREFAGNVGHGRNQITLGPDGRIYSICGDAVDLPQGVLDRTSPFREARRGPAPREGFVTAYDPQTEEWELFCAGMRNPFGIAFNSDGEAFTYDADAEFDMGAPWYRPTRILHLTSGADFGWRAVTKQWPPYDPDRPDFALPVFDVGKGSPTAVEFGYGSDFPPQYRHALFVLDWAYGRVLAVHFKPRGASYVAQAETFLQGQPLNVCGLDFGPDGAMYLVTGGRGTQSGLYRVRWSGGASSDNRESTHAVRRIEYSETMRLLRRSLEHSNARPDRAELDSIWQQLDSDDPALRYAARTALEHLPVEEWRDRALDETRTTASLEALTALARNGDAGDLGEIVDGTLRHDFSEMSLSQQLTMLGVWQLCRLVDPAALDEHRNTLIPLLLPAVTAQKAQRISPCGNGERLRREAARLLRQLDAPGLVELLIARLVNSETQEDRLHYLFLLRDVGEGWTAQSRRVFFTELQKAGRFVRGEGMPGFLAAIREAAVTGLSDKERDELTELLEAEATDAPAVDRPRPVVRQWTVDDVDELLREPDAGPDARHGEVLFRDALCSRCHRVGATGPAAGPDLTFVGRRFGRRDILLSILEPDRVVAENYRNVEVVTKDGRVITGRAVVAGDYRSQTLKIATDPLRPGEVVEIEKPEIDLHRLARTSPMPKGLLNPFTAEEIRDLLAYLESGLQPAAVDDDASGVE